MGPLPLSLSLRPWGLSGTQSLVMMEKKKKKAPILAPLHHGPFAKEATPTSMSQSRRAWEIALMPLWLTALWRVAWDGVQ